MATKAQLEQRLNSALEETKKLKNTIAGYDRGVEELKTQLDRILAGVVRQFGTDVADDDGSIIGRRVILNPALMAVYGKAHVAPSEDGYVLALMGGDADGTAEQSGLLEDN